MPNSNRDEEENLQRKNISTLLFGIERIAFVTIDDAEVAFELLFVHSSTVDERKENVAKFRPADVSICKENFRVAKREKRGSFSPVRRFVSRKFSMNFSKSPLSIGMF